MLVGGEDYGLLLTIRAEVFDNLVKEFQQKFGYALTKIGSIKAGNGVELREGGKTVQFTHRPFSHFGEL